MLTKTSGATCVRARACVTSGPPVSCFLRPRRKKPATRGSLLWVWKSAYWLRRFCAPPNVRTRSASNWSFRRVPDSDRAMLLGPARIGRNGDSVGGGGDIGLAQPNEPRGVQCFAGERRFFLFQWQCTREHMRRGGTTG